MRHNNYRRTIAIYVALDGWAADWISGQELAHAVMDDFHISEDRSRRHVSAWAKHRGINVVLAGKFKFYCSRPQASPDPTVLRQKYWGLLPDGFRRAHNFDKCGTDEGINAILMAYGALRLGRKDCLEAFNKWALAHKQPRISKDLPKPYGITY